jgi:hypothetical protein
LVSSARTSCRSLSPLNQPQPTNTQPNNSNNNSNKLSIHRSKEPTCEIASPMLLSTTPVLIVPIVFNSAAQHSTTREQQLPKSVLT